ncbi:16S rRNA (guanine(527)-N(7))-methyltransferase RsmG [Pseudoruegeria sp. SHC-113]|uniref:16S rRNA (guanine(527)-N(7))-methyltransferase RsmG n=1 Tax=Pseudoruegeria sp. SHC-113 TaxID=2855439 RepID=UPI0021BB4737|nr:16S rRNA (guanine(527)-N(7))-methyltransferase RsmG [Pseudoruegeria sp. SHC-113]MCT8158576.1 16S rRNA (guanine(527)-N(7))-methyltransferase RsmG [Pseudoruegeria sp. SHC-113]
MTAGQGGLQDVSRETLERLKTYAALLEKWNPAINLVAKSTLKDLWTRHFVDSAQIYDLAPNGFAHWADLGSGGGFPGMVCAILALEKAPEARFTLVESDQRKSAFLRTVARETGANVDVLASRIEKTQPLCVDVLSARALASLDVLLEFAELHLKPSGRAIFPKGESYQQEISEAKARWHFSAETIPSITDGKAVILAIGGIERV